MQEKQEQRSSSQAHSHHRRHHHRRHSHSRQRYSTERQRHNNKELHFMIFWAAIAVALMLLLIPLLTNFLEQV